MKEVLRIENTEINKISLFDGSSGTRSTITNPQQIKEFLSLFDNVYLRKRLSQAGTSGFIISVGLYSNDKPLDSSSFNFGLSIVQTSEERYISSHYFSNDELADIRKKYGLTH